LEKNKKNISWKIGIKVLVNIKKKHMIWSCYIKTNNNIISQIIIFLIQIIQIIFITQIIIFFYIKTLNYYKNNNIYNTNNNIFYIKTLNYYKNNNIISQIIIYLLWIHWIIKKNNTVLQYMHYSAE